MKKLLIIIGAILIAVIVIGGVGLWYWMEKPLYEPGMVRAGKNLRSPLTPPEQSGSDRIWNVEKDIQLYHFSAGKGRNVLIVHGGPGYPYSRPWSGLEPLADRFKFHYYDQRGCGQSTRPFDRFTSSNYYENLTTLERTLGIGAQVADIERIRQILGEEKLVLVGHSFGGFLASLYAAEFPERVQAMILIAPAPMLVFPVQGGGLYEDVEKRLPEELQAEYAAYMKRYLDFQNVFAMSESELSALNDGFAKYYAAATQVSTPEQGQAGGWMVYAMYFSMGRRHDYRSALKRVRAPVLVIHGGNDLQTEQASRTYVEALPNARLHIMPDAAHFAYDERPQEFSAVVAEFLSSLK